MIENQDVLYGVSGQELAVFALEGRPASVTSSDVFLNSHGDDGTAEVALSGNAAINAADTTFDSAAGDSEANPNLVPLVDTSWIKIGSQYVVTNAAGESEIIEVRQITSGDSVESRHPLTNDYAIGDTFEGIAITHDFLLAWVSDESNLSGSSPNPSYRWRLEYVGGDGATHVQHSYFDLVRYSTETTVSGLDVDAAYPWLNWLDTLPTSDREDRGARIIKEAQRQVKLKLFHAGKADQAMRNREAMEDLVMHRAAFLVAGSDLDARAAIAENFDAAYSNFILAGQVDTDTSGSGAAGPTTPTRVTRR